MIILYLSLLFALIATRWVMLTRARALEKKYSRIAAQAKMMSHRPQHKAGNSSKPRDHYQVARQQYELGQLVAKRDRVEEKYTRWQSRSESVGKVLSVVQSLKGRITPYVMGMVDLVLAVYLLDQFGVVDNPSVQTVKEQIASMF